MEENIQKGLCPGNKSDNLKGCDLMKVALTIRSFGDKDSEAWSLLKKSGIEIWENSSGKHLAKEEIIKCIADVDGVIAGTERFDREVLASSTRLKVISRVGVGIDSIDIDAAREYRITIKNTPLAPVRSVAEHVFAMIFALCRRMKEHTANLENGVFKALTGYLLKGKIIGIIGFGNVGKEVAAMGLCLGCQIIYYDPAVEGFNNARRMNSLQHLFSLADIVTIHASASKTTEKMVSRGILDFARQGQIIINTARGSMIDEDALLDFLENGKLLGAGLDVFQEEPYKGPLAHHPRVIATPHVSSNTVETRRMMESEAVSNLLSELKIEGV